MTQTGTTIKHECCAHARLLAGENAKLLSVLLLAGRIVAKVVEQDLMPHIAAPDFPRLVLEKIDAAIGRREVEGFAGADEWRDVQGGQL